MKNIMKNIESDHFYLCPPLSGTIEKRRNTFVRYYQEEEKTKRKF